MRARMRLRMVLRQPTKPKQLGFSVIEVFLVVLVLAVLAVIGIMAYQQHKPSVVKNSSVTSSNQTTTQPKSNTTNQPAQPTVQPDPYQGWNTYNDTGYAAASGISIKYPSDWQINITRVKKIGNTKNPTAVINERVVFLPTSETPKEEWDTCATNVSADACGAAPGDKTLSNNESSINGLAVYTATMQNSNYTYHVTVIRGSKSTSPAGRPYVEFTTIASDPAALKTYAAIIASATFPN
jgi:Tfp pilus assembly protein PilV